MEKSRRVSRDEIRKRIRKKDAEDVKKKTQTGAIRMKNLTLNDFKRGIIFHEVLGPPRAKRPYRPVYYRHSKNR